MTARDIAALFDALELDLVKSLHRCLARHQQQEQTEGGKNGTPRYWQAWQAAKLRDIRRFRRENTAILGEYRDRIDADTRTLLEEEAAQGGTDGFFRMDDTRMTALLNEMQQANEQSERAALRYMNDVYRKTILRTAAAMQAGGQTLQQATDAATRDFLEQGIACIRYRDGRRVNISTYAEMALRIAGTRAMLMGEAAQRERLGIDTVLVSQYGACSKTCLPWQGLVYIDDVFQQYSGPHTPGGTYGISRNGRQYPLLSVAMQGGLFHPNCRHTLSTWVEGTSTRPRPMDKAKVEAAAQLENAEPHNGNDERYGHRHTEGLFYPAILFRPKIVAVDGLCAGCHPNKHGMCHLINLHHDTIAGQSDFTAVFCDRTAVCHKVVHDDLCQRRCHLHTETRETQRKDTAAGLAGQFQVFFIESDMFKSWDIRHTDEPSHYLTDDGGNSRSCDTHVKAKNEDRV